ncbi:MAG TPA: hypothetical protein VKS79_21310 [Gemmataceae bacterium]|nr:hypothetical protein [Gemmataceae bacterium]
MKAKPTKTECLAAARLAFERGRLHAIMTTGERNTLEAAWADYEAGTLSIDELQAAQAPIVAAAWKRQRR